LACDTSCGCDTNLPGGALRNRLRRLAVRLPGKPRVALVAHPDTYGRFPAHANSWYKLGIWVQFSHLENEYCEKYERPEHWRRQAAHDGVWHP
jgi:hypothetical protein